MNKNYEILSIEKSKLVISKSYLSLGEYFYELESVLKTVQFEGIVYFDLMLSNGHNAKNRFMYSDFKNNKLNEPEILNPKKLKNGYKNAITEFFSNNISILKNGILSTSVIEKMEHTLNFVY